MPQIIKGTYTSTGAARRIELPTDPDFVELFIQGDATGSNWNSVANPAVTKRASWFKDMAPGSAFTVINTVGAATDASSFITTNGFTYYNGSVQTPEIAQVGTIVSQAAAAIVTINGHTFVTGDRVVLSNVTGMRQIEGMEFTVTYLGVNTFSIPINTSAFLAPATAVTARKLPALPLFAPREQIITGISQANPCVVQLSETHDFVVGSVVRIVVPAAYGMIQLNDVQATVTAITATSITLNLDSTAFTAFAYPTSAAYRTSFPLVVPMGEVATILTNSMENTSFRGLELGTSVVGPNGAKVFYIAYKADLIV